MWRCPQCNELIDAPLAVCWQCGTASDGTVNPYFHRAEPADPTGNEPDLDIEPFQFNRTLLALVALCLFFLAAWQSLGQSIIAFLALIILGNIFSAAVGIIVTLILPKPDDSGNYP